MLCSVPRNGAFGSNGFVRGAPNTRTGIDGGRFETSIPGGTQCVACTSHTHVQPWLLSCVAFTPPSDADDGAAASVTAATTAVAPPRRAAMDLARTGSPSALEVAPYGSDLWSRSFGNPRCAC